MSSLYYARFSRLTTNWGFAGLAWIAAGLYLFATRPGNPFLSRQGLLFFLVGIPVASLAFGSISCLLIVALGIWGPRRLPYGPEPGDITVILAAEAVSIFLTARWVLP